MPEIGQYRLTPPTMADGDLGPIQLDASGNLKAQVQGNVASAATDSGNPVKVGAVVTTAAPAAVYTTGQRSNLSADAYGCVRVIPGEALTAADGTANNGMAGFRMSGNWGPLLTSGFVFNGSSWDRMRGDTNALIARSALGSASWAYAGVTGGITNTADVALMAAAGAGVRNFLHSIQWKNTSTVASEIVVKDGATVIWRGHVSASMTVMDGWTFDPPLRGTANTALNVAMLTTGTATIVSAQGSTGA